jgi:hypothetical protein
MRTPFARRDFVSLRAARRSGEAEKLVAEEVVKPRLTARPERGPM